MKKRRQVPERMSEGVNEYLRKKWINNDQWVNEVMNE